MSSNEQLATVTPPQEPDGLLVAVPRQQDADVLASIGVPACLYDKIPAGLQGQSVLVIPLNTPDGIAAARSITARLRRENIRAAQLPTAQLQHVPGGGYAELMVRFHKGNADEWHEKLHRDFEMALERQKQEDSANARNRSAMAACSAAQALKEPAYHELLTPVGLLGSGIPELDVKLGGGLGLGETTIISAGPGAAKTTLAVNIAYNVALSKPTGSSARDGWPVVVLSEEMPAADIWKLLLCADAGISRTRLRTGNLTREDHTALANARTRLSGMPLTVLPPGSVPSRVDLDALIRQNPEVKLWVLDHADCLDRAEDALTRLPELAAVVLRAAQEIKTHVIVLSHTNKAALVRRVSTGPGKQGKQKRSFELEDQRGLVTVTGTYVNVIGLTVDSPRDTPRPELTIHVAKARYGSTWKVDVPFERSTGRIGHYLPGYNPPTVVEPIGPKPDLQSHGQWGISNA